MDNFIPLYFQRTPRFFLNQAHYAVNPCALNLIPGVIIICKISFCVFGNCAKRNSNIRNDFFFFEAFKRTLFQEMELGWTVRHKTKVVHLLILRKHGKNFFPCIQIIRGMTLTFKYHSKFKFCSKICLVMKQGPKWGRFMKKSRSKISCSVPFRIVISNKFRLTNCSKEYCTRKCLQILLHSQF
jgi:hypothetical protein